MNEIARRGLCLVLAAPSGAGKTAITRGLLASEPRLHLSISVTPRAPRAGEVDGVRYHFRTEADFLRATPAAELQDWDPVLKGRHYYGTPRAPVEAALAAGNDVVFDIDCQGHRQLRAKLPGDLVSVFVLPPSLAVLEARLRTRAGDDEAEIVRRMRVARDEISHWADFDHVVVNDDLTEAVASVRAILLAARLATARQTGLPGFIGELG